MKHCIRLPQSLPSFDLACKKQVSVSPSWPGVQTFAITESVIFLGRSTFYVGTQLKKSSLQQNRVLARCYT